MHCLSAKHPCISLYFGSSLQEAGLEAGLCCDNLLLSVRDGEQSPFFQLSISAAISTAKSAGDL